MSMGKPHPPSNPYTVLRITLEGFYQESEYIQHYRNIFTVWLHYYMNNNQPKIYKEMYEVFDVAKEQIYPKMEKRDFVEVFSRWVDEAPESDKVQQFINALILELKSREE